MYATLGVSLHIYCLLQLLQNKNFITLIFKVNTSSVKKKPSNTYNNGTIIINTETIMKNDFYINISNNANMCCIYPVL